MEKILSPSFYINHFRNKNENLMVFPKECGQKVGTLLSFQGMSVNNEKIIWKVPQYSSMFFKTRLEAWSTTMSSTNFVQHHSKESQFKYYNGCG